MKKKLLAIIVAAVMLCGMLAGCGNSSAKNNPSPPLPNASNQNNSSNTNGNTNNNNTNNSSANNNTTNNNAGNNNNNNNSTQQSSPRPNNTQNGILQVPVTIINETGATIAKLYASGANNNNWGNNLIGNGSTLPSGYSVNVIFSIDVNSLQWDFKAFDLYGNTLTFKGLDLSRCQTSGVTITLTYDAQTNIGKITAK